MIPLIKWAQTSDSVIFKIFIDNVSNLTITFINNKLEFSCNSNNQDYNLSVNFYKQISSDLTDHSYKITETYIDCKVKKDNTENWDFLVENQSFYKHHIKIDWHRWVDSAADLENHLDDNLESLMQNIYSNQNDKPIDATLNEENNAKFNINGLEVEDENNGVASGESTPMSSDNDDELCV